MVELVHPGARRVGHSTSLLPVLQRKEINILKRVSFNRHVVQFYGFCLEESAPMLVSRSATVCALGL